MGPIMLTVGMLTYDDYDGVFFTLNAIRMYHREISDKIHFCVVDNNPESKHGEEVRRLCKLLGRCNYNTISGASASTFKNMVFEVAPTDQVLCMDCHVLLWPKSLNRLVKFYEQNPWAKHDLIQGPLINENHDVIATHMLPSFRGWNFGIWHNDGRANDETAAPFEIPLQGMGLFACSRQGWLRYSPGMRYFGAEEGTIHEKFRRSGRKTWCLPFLRWLHRFGRPGGAPYHNTAESKIRNYLMSFRDADLPLEHIAKYFTRHLHPNIEVANKKMEELLKWANSLPPSTLPPKPQGYKPFLSIPVEYLD